ncbi:amphoterin-induced protein 1 [Ambystoma mexicanum]|uniref:amphoterin-induced protein 1 n=1 Tax=Ambystoma mexicanum TaxID=8296 RepID=UPI0037E7607E
MALESATACLLDLPASDRRFNALFCRSNMWCQHAPRSVSGTSWFLALCLLNFRVLGVEGSELNCRTGCICASNIVSCTKKELVTIPTKLPRYTAILDLSYNNLKGLSAEWLRAPLSRLQTLLLSHNELTFVSTEAFLRAPHIKHLDLSSNKIEELNENVFSELQELEVLLLYNNLISHIDRTAFDDASSLQKVYLSQNHISRFPLELVKDGAKLPELLLLDLSSNKLKKLPVPELKELPAWIRNGLYLHSNPLACDCQLYSLLMHWQIRQLASVVDFREDLKCVLVTHEKTTVSIFSLDGAQFMNCSVIKEADMEAYLGETVTIDCDTKQRGMTQVWVTPNNELVPPKTNQATNRTMAVLANGSLQIRPIQVEDKGTYTCYAESEMFNETLFVTLMVYNFTQHGHQDTLNTAYTTLVGCIASIILVLIYLYLTPCRCCCRGEEKKNEGEDSIHSSMLSATPNHETASDKVALNRHVAFIEPSGNLQGQNGKLKPNGAQEGPDGKRTHKQPRKMSDPGSISSAFSDTPIMV